MSYYTGVHETWSMKVKVDSRLRGLKDWLSGRGGSVYPDMFVLSTQIEYGEVNSGRTERIDKWTLKIILTNANVEARGKQEKFDYIHILDTLKRRYPHLILSVNFIYWRTGM